MLDPQREKPTIDFTGTWVLRNNEVKRIIWVFNPDVDIFVESTPIHADGRVLYWDDNGLCYEKFDREMPDNLRLKEYDLMERISKTKEYCPFLRS